MFTPQASNQKGQVSPIVPSSHQQGQRISLALSDLVSPGLKDFDDLESETRTTVSSLNDGTNYKKELKKLLTKARGTAYEATLRRFVEAKYTEIKKDEASNRKIFGHSRGAGAVGPPSLATLSTSRYDSPSPMTLREANAMHFSGGSYRDGRIVENNYSHLASPKSAGKPAISHKGYSILNEMSHVTPKNVSLEVSYNNKTRIEEMAKPVPRNMYKGPPAPASPFASTNHLGRQRPPPQAARASPGRRVSASPEPSRHRGQFSSVGVGGGGSLAGGSLYGDGDGTTSIATMPTFIQRAMESQRAERTYAEFHDWLASNREWARRREFKLQSKESEVLHRETHDFKPKITRKSGKLAEVANERDFHRMAEAVQSRGGALGRGQGGRLRSRSRSPGGVFMHVAPPSTLYDSAHHPDHQDGQVPERPSWDILKSTELLQNEGMHHGSTGGAGRRERSDSVVSTNSERSSSIRGDRRRHSSLNAGQQASHEAPSLRVFSSDEHSALTAPSIHPDHSHAHHHPSSGHHHVHIAKQPSRDSAEQTQWSSPPPPPPPAPVPVVDKPPSDVYERLATRGRLKAQQTYNYEPPVLESTFKPTISERSARLAARKHERDAIVRARSLSADPHRRRGLDSSDVHVFAATGRDFLSRNYDYYELYSMPQRYLERAASPMPYKQHGRRSATAAEPTTRVLEGTGLSRVAEKVASRSSSPVPAQRSGDAALAPGVSNNAGPAVGTDGDELRLSDDTVRADEGGKYHTAGKPNTSTTTTGGGTADRTLQPDAGGKYRTFCPSPRNANRSPSPAGYFSRPTSPGAESNATAHISVTHVAKEAIERRRALSRRKREQALEEFNRTHYLRKEPVPAKPFQPVLMATETHKIMARVRSTFEERTTKSVENQVVRREVAKMFPSSPGPGRYTGGIGVDKLVQALSTGSPVRVTRSRSMSPVPGHRGFSFSRDPLGRSELPDQKPTSPLLYTLNSAAVATAAGGKSPAKGAEKS